MSVSVIILGIVFPNLTKQLYEWSFPSVRLSHLFHNVPVIHSRLIPICNAFFIQRGHRRSLPIGEESDGGHRIKRALYIGIKRLCCHRIIMKCSRVFTIDKSVVHIKGQESKVRVTEVKTNFAPM